MDKGLREFEEITKRDPLFAAEGMDLENAERALDRIEELLRETEGAFSKGSFLRRLFLTRYPLTKYAMPIAFLRAFLVSEKNRRSFLAAPSTDSATVLVTSWEKAAELHGRSLKKYRALHEVLMRFESRKKEFSIVDAFGNRTGIVHIRGLLQLLAKNADALSAEVALRKRVLLGGTMPEYKKSKTNSITLEKGTMTAGQSMLHELEVKQRVEPFRRSEIAQKYGPFTYTLALFEGTPTPHSFILYVMRDRDNGIRSMWVAADRFLFTKVWNDGGKVDMSNATRYFFSGGLKAEDMRYWYEPAGHLYITRDPRYWMDIATLVDLERRPQLDRSRVLEQRSSTFDLLLGACGLDLWWYLKHTKRRARTGGFGEYSYLYGLLMRSFPSLLYLTFNMSVWRIAENAPFIGESFASFPDSPYRSEAEVLSALQPDELEKVMSAQRIREEREMKEGWI